MLITYTKGKKKKKTTNFIYYLKIVIVYYDSRTSTPPSNINGLFIIYGLFLYNFSDYE